MKRGKAKPREDVAPTAWVKVVAARQYGKKLQAFMTAWVLECRMLDEYHEMNESMYGENYTHKYFPATDVILETAELFTIEEEVNV